MTDADFLAWLLSPSAIRCVLAEVKASVAGVETTRYLASRGYVTKPTDAPANTEYVPALQGGGVITEQLGVDGSGAALAFGDLEIDNADGSRDAWLLDVWANRQVRLWVGDVRWVRADFRLVFDGVTAELQSRSREVLNLVVRDKAQRLASPVMDTRLGGATANADKLLPVCLGEAHNVTPLLVDPATLEYQVHAGTMERLIEVRDSGVPVAVTTTLATGKFRLNQALAGDVTASMQGDKSGGVYRNTVATLVQLLATGYGADPLSGADLDAANLAAFDAANAQPVGLWLDARALVLECCQQLAGSVGARLVISATGLLRLVKLELPAPGTATLVDASKMAEHSLAIARRLPVKAAVKVGYARNWTVQTGLQTGVPAAHKDLYAQEWLTVTANDAAVAAAYRITDEPPQEDSCLLRQADASAEATRRLDLCKVQRTVFRFEGLPELLLLELGGGVTLQHARFGLLGGVGGQVVTLTKDWINARLTVEVLV